MENNKLKKNYINRMLKCNVDECKFFFSIVLI